MAETLSIHWPFSLYHGWTSFLIHVTFDAFVTRRPDIRSNAFTFLALCVPFLHISLSVTWPSFYKSLPHMHNRRLHVFHSQWRPSRIHSHHLVSLHCLQVPASTFKIRSLVCTCFHNRLRVRSFAGVTNTGYVSCCVEGWGDVAASRLSCRRGTSCVERAGSEELHYQDWRRRFDLCSHGRSRKEWCDLKKGSFCDGDVSGMSSVL
jgi:hypothetical protein